MRILFDHNVPRDLRRLFVGHEVSTAKREGWDVLTNGRLLAAAERAGFDLLVTFDQGIFHQQSMTGRGISIATLISTDQTRSAFETVVRMLLGRLDSIGPGTLVVIDASPSG